MSYKLKTLIVFDTNSLRSTEAGEVAYSFFALGRPFQVIEDFIIEKSLNEDIHIAIPTWAIEELKDQKNRQYLLDINKYNEVTTRLFGLPNFQKIPIPNPEFDCISYVQEKADEFLKDRDIKLIGIPEEIANTVLQSMMNRVMKDEREKQPFVHAKKGNKTYKDAGFKDNLIWESLLHFQEIANYDKIIFLTQDSDYNTNCKTEFVDKWNKHFSILSDENNVIVEIQKDYEFYINERAIYDYAQTDYFKDYLSDNLKMKSEIMIDDHNYKIENFKLIDTCTNISRIPPNEHMIESLYITSELKVFFKADGKKKEQIVTATTSFADEETKEIIETFYDFDLI